MSDELKKGEGQVKECVGEEGKREGEYQAGRGGRPRRKEEAGI